MAVSDKGDFQLFEAQFHGGFVEISQQVSRELIEPSMGAISITPNQHQGDFWEESFFTSDNVTYTRRDPSTDGTATADKVVMDEDKRVNLSRRMGPTEILIDAWRRIGEAGEDAIARTGQVRGRQAAKAAIDDRIDQALAACVGALENEGTNETDQTDGTIVTADLATALELMGDRASRVNVWIMHSHVYWDLVQDQVANGPVTDNVAGFAVNEGAPVTLGRRVLVTDSPSLKETDGVSSGVDEYRTLGLTEGALPIFNGERQLFTEIVGGRDNLKVRWQGEDSYTLGVKGFKWGSTANPTDAALATGSNWTVTMNSNKDLAGVLLRTR